MGGIAIKDPTQYIGKSAHGRLFRNNGLHIEVMFEPDHPIGKTDPSGISDVILEAALTTIVDLEDSVAAVDADDKVAAYTNWLGLMRGDLVASFEKGGRTMTRALDATGISTGSGAASRPRHHCSPTPTPPLKGRGFDPCRSQPDVRAQCRPFDDQSGGPAPRWQRSARRHTRRGVHLALCDARPERPRHTPQQPRWQHLYRQAQACTAPKNAPSPTICSMRSKTSSA